MQIGRHEEEVDPRAVRVGHEAGLARDAEAERAHTQRAAEQLVAIARAGEAVRVGHGTSWSTCAWSKPRIASTSSRSVHSTCPCRLSIAIGASRSIWSTSSLML